MSRNSLKSVIKLIDQAQNRLSPEQSFLQDLKRSIEIGVETSASGYKPSRTYKPSSMNCMRNMYYQVVGAEPDPPAPSYIMEGIVNSGSDTHVRIQKYICGMERYGIDCAYVDVPKFIEQRKLTDLTVRSKVGMETKLYHEKLNLSFMTDGIIRYKDHYYVLEIKTESSYKWQNRNGVDPKHYNQATAYAVAFGLNEAIFLYINRDLLDMKAFLFNVTDEMKMDFVGMIANCDDHVKNNRVPNKVADKKVCEYCGYKTTCRKEN